MSRQILNNTELLKLLEGIVFDQRLSQILIDDIVSSHSDANEKTALFYNLAKGTGALETLRKRLVDLPLGLLICNNPQALELDHSNIIVVQEEHFQEAQKRMLETWYPLSSLKIEEKLVGITGTNGKTTVAHFCMEIAEQFGKKAMTIGTLGCRNQQGLLESNNTLTTPSFIDLHKKLFRYLPDHDVCFMEVSSHALEQKRVEGLKFKVGAWTNLTQDHLDYHQNMDNYFSAKLKMATQYLLGPLFVPQNQTELMSKIKKSFQGELVPANWNPNSKSSALPDFLKIKFNWDNLALAKAMNEFLWGESRSLNLTKLTTPEGRMFVHTCHEKMGIVDSAHTPDALINICEAIRQSYPNKKLNILFGCGGDRDASKRPQMAKVVNKYAEKIYLTTDNVRGEDPSTIFYDTKTGLELAKTLQVCERSLAVKMACQELDSEHILLLAGKGHEDYQLIKGKKKPYSDIEALKSCLL